MTNNQVCGSCKTQMGQVGALNSGNSKYLTFRCDRCHNEKTVCVGVGR